MDVVKSISQLEIDANICHTTHGQGVVAAFERKQGTRRGSPLEMLEKKMNKMGADEEDRTIIQQLKKWDIDGDGHFSVDEVHQACKHFMHTKAEGQAYKKMLITGTIVSIVIMGVLLGLMVGAIEATKDTRPAERDTGELGH